eukprot:364533_1
MSTIDPPNTVLETTEDDIVVLDYDPEPKPTSENVIMHQIHDNNASDSSSISSEESLDKEKDIQLPKMDNMHTIKSNMHMAPFSINTSNLNTNNIPNFAIDNSNLNRNNNLSPAKPTTKVVVPLSMDSTLTLKPANITPTPNQKGQIGQILDTLQRVDTLQALRVCQVMKNKYLYSRIFIILFTILLFILSCFYAIGQILDVRLNIIVLCNDKKTNEQIWQYNAMRDNNLNAQTQGLPQQSCMTTRSVYIDYLSLWNSNHYLHQWTPINIRCVAFVMLCVYCLIIMIFAIYTLVVDVILMKQNALHTKSSKYKSYMAHNSTTTTSKITKKKNAFTEICTDKIFGFFSKFKVDTGYWVMLMFVHEIFEITLQSQALLIYNGYNLFDPNNENDVYLANKPIFIQCFAIFIMFNCFSSGIVWICYAFATKRCHGYIFKISIFFVDQLSDLLYSIFPLIIVLGDNYNTNDSNFNVLLGQLTTTSTLQFFAAFAPLFL